MSQVPAYTCLRNRDMHDRRTTIRIEVRNWRVYVGSTGHRSPLGRSCQMSLAYTRTRSISDVRC